MTVHRKESLLLHHAFSRLRLVHAAFVDSFEVHATDNRLPVNRFLFVVKNDSEQKSIFRDIANNRLFPMRENNLYFIPYNYLIDLNIEADLHFVSFQFNLDIFCGFDVFEAYPQCETRELPELNASLPDLLNREDKLETLCRVNEIIYGLCADFCKSEPIDISEKLSHSEKYRQILNFIYNFGNATVTVEQLAEISKMRRDVFSRNFTRDLNITPKDFISDTLVRKASEMLMNPGILIKDVAETLQFSSEYYFSNFFKKQVGMSPREFRRHNGIK
jgi:AraC-like DNA-binding protein